MVRKTDRVFKRFVKEYDDKHLNDKVIQHIRDE